MRFQILSTLALFGLALADQSVIASQFGGKSFRDLDVAVVHAKDSLLGWKGDYLGIAPLLQESSRLIASIKAAATIPWDPAVVTIPSEAQDNIFVDATNLVTDVGLLADTMISIKVKVLAFPILGRTLVLTAIRDLRKEASELIRVYIQFANEDKREDCEALARTFTSHVDRAEAAFA